MSYFLNVSDASQRHMIVLGLSERLVKAPAIDVVFDVLGAEPESLVSSGTLTEGQVEDFKALQNMIFDRDSQGMFIRDDVTFRANGSDLNPDASMISSFLPATKEGIQYKRCELVVGGLLASSDSFDCSPTVGAVPAGTGQQGSVPELAKLYFLHRLAIGTLVDVTKDLPELIDVIQTCEQEGLIEIDVKNASYKLTTKGTRTHDSYIEEAQTLIRRYDIFGDVDVDGAGQVHFETGLGQDVRVAVFEVEGIDPFRARFILGLNDKEWDALEDWEQLTTSESWYREIFAPIEQASTVDEIGKGKLLHIIDRGKAKLRQESAS